jgi:hypothetical protein
MSCGTSHGQVRVACIACSRQGGAPARHRWAKARSRQLYIDRDKMRSVASSLGRAKHSRSIEQHSPGLLDRWIKPLAEQRRLRRMSVAGLGSR